MHVKRGEGCNSHIKGIPYLSGLGSNDILAKESAAFIDSKLKRSETGTSFHMQIFKFDNKSLGLHEQGRNLWGVWESQPQP